MKQTVRKLLVIVGGVIFIAVVVIVVFATTYKSEVSDFTSDFANSYNTSCEKPKHSSEIGRYTSAAVSSDASPCGTIAIDILKRNGTAADAAIAAMFCVGVINAQSCGLGGGFVATYYSKEEGKVYSLDAREVAPKDATPTMYNPQLNSKFKEEKKWYEKGKSANNKGGITVAVPGESVGLYELYKRFGGGLEWRELLEPAIKICEEGYKLTWYTGGLLYTKRADIRAEPSMSIFMKSSEGRILHRGETVYRKQLAKTLRVLQEEPEALHKGSLADAFATDLTKFGGIITKDDLSEYRPKWKEPIVFHLQNGNYSFYSFPPPGSGIIVGLILNILDEYNMTASNLAPEEAFRTQQRVAESFKYSYARRFQMGDLTDEETATLAELLTSDDFAASVRKKLSDETTNQDPRHYGTEVVPDADEGTAHLSLLAPNGDAIAITSSINYAFGAGIRSETTGIIYNNQMTDFTTSEAYSKPGAMKMDKNLITPGNRPLSSMSPSIIVDKNGDVRLVVGAAGGIRIPSAIAWVSARNLWMGQDIKESIDACRSHHNLIPMKLQFEKGFPKVFIEYLKERGHVLKQYKWKSVVQAVGRDTHGHVVANSDYRKSGEVRGF